MAVKPKAKSASKQKDVKKEKTAGKAKAAAPKAKAAPKKQAADIGPKPADARGAFFWTLKNENISEEIIEAFETVDPGLFYNIKYKDRFYTDAPIPVGNDQVGGNFISLARMINYLNPKEGQRILEVGTGSGYSTAILSLLCKEVATVDADEELAAAAKERLFANDFGNIRFYAGDATDNENDYGKIDGAIINAACRKRPLTILENMTPGGVVVYPMGPAHLQQITVMKNKEDLVRGERFITTFHESTVFSLIEGMFGYDTPANGGIFGEAGEMDPPKSIDSNPSLFEPPTED